MSVYLSCLYTVMPEAGTYRIAYDTLLKFDTCIVIPFVSSMIGIL